MAQETAPATTPEIDLRWTMAMYGRPTRYSNREQIFLSLTKRFNRVNRGLEDLAAMLVDDGVWEEEMQDADADSLVDLTGEAWEAIEKLLKAWAARAPERRRAIQSQRGEERAAKAGTAA